MNIVGLIIAFLQATAEVAPIIKMSMQAKLTKDEALQKAKDELLQEWKTAYGSHDISVVTDALRRLRTSQE